jgi:hypothetical protein
MQVIRGAAGVRVTNRYPEVPVGVGIVHSFVGCYTVTNQLHYQTVSMLWRLLCATTLYFVSGEYASGKQLSASFLIFFHHVWQVSICTSMSLQLFVVNMALWPVFLIDKERWTLKISADERVYLMNHWMD